MLINPLEARNAVSSLLIARIYPNMRLEFVKKGKRKSKLTKKAKLSI